jgi:hypothetical protein
MQWKEKAPMRRYRRLLAIPAAALATAALATAALAVSPERILHEVYVDDVIPSEACGFPIAVHVEGTVRETMFFDRDGEWVRAMNTPVDLKETWTNMLTGAWAWTVHTATGHLTLNEDGTAYLSITGVQGRVESPDGGFVTDTGRLVLYIPDFWGGGFDELVVFNGRDDGQGGPFPELCDALA